MFLRPPQGGGKDGIGQPGSREKEIGFERYPTFQNRGRFGSMNPITMVSGAVWWCSGGVGNSFWTRFPVWDGEKL